MNFFSKKNLIIIFAMFCILGISIYFFTKDSNYENLSTENFLITEDPVEITDIKEIIIHIDGEVQNPGIVTLPEGSRISDAIFSAGGATSSADLSKVNLAYSVKDGQKIFIPSIYDEISDYIQNDAGDNVIVPDSSSDSSLININLASQAELETLPGVGPSTASKIIDYRTKNGDFKALEDIMNVNGIGQAKFDSFKDYICI